MGNDATDEAATNVARPRRSKAKRAVVKLTAAGKRKRFIAVMAKTANASAAARAAGMASSTAYRQRAKHDSFRAAWDEAREEALDGVEASLLRRGSEGVEKPIIYRGKKIATVTTYSDAAAMFILRGRRRAIFGNQRPAAAPSPTEATSAGGDDWPTLKRELERFALRSPDA